MTSGDCTGEMTGKPVSKFLNSFRSDYPKPRVGRCGPALGSVKINHVRVSKI